MIFPYNPSFGDTFQTYRYDGTRWVKDTEGVNLMAANVYDPNGRRRDVFDRRYHKGEIRQRDVENLLSDMAYLRSLVDQGSYIKGETILSDTASKSIYIENMHYYINLTRNMSLYIRTRARQPDLNSAIFHVNNTGDFLLSFNGYKLDWTWESNKMHELLFVAPINGQAVGSCRPLE